MNALRSVTLALCLVAGLSVAGACTSEAPAPRPAATQFSSIFDPTPAPSLDAQPVELQGKPVAARYGLGAAWISIDAPTSDDPRVVKIDQATKKVELTIEGPHRIAVGRDAVWGAESPEYMGRSTLRKIDPDSGKTLLAVNARFPFDVSIGSDAVWITTMQDGVGRVDPRTGAITMLETVGSYVLATEEAVWVSDTDSGQVLRIDPETNTVTAKVPFDNPRDLTAFEDSIWVGNDGGQVARIDARDNRRTIISGTGAVKAITACGNAIWAPHSDGGVHRIDPSSNESQLALPLENDSHLGIACGGDQVWVTSMNDFAVYYHRLR